MGGLSFYPGIPLQHTSSFCKTFSVLSRYVCMHNTENSIPGPLDFKIFWGTMPPDPPGGSYLRPSYLITPLNKYSRQYEHPSKNLSYAPVSYTLWSDRRRLITKISRTSKRQHLSKLSTKFFFLFFWLYSEKNFAFRQKHF